MNSIPKLPATTPVTASETLRLLENSSVLREMREEAAAEVLARRKAQAAELHKLERDAVRDFPKLRASLDAAIGELRELEKSLEAARDKYRAAANRVSSVSFERSRARDHLEAQLRETAPPEIDQFIRWARDDWDATAKAASTSLETRRQKVTGQRRLIGTSNAPSVRVRLEALRTAIAAAEELKLEAIESSSVADRLDKLRAELPPVAFVDVDQEA